MAEAALFTAGEFLFQDQVEEVEVGHRGASARPTYSASDCVLTEGRYADIEVRAWEFGGRR